MGKFDKTFLGLLVVVSVILIIVAGQDFNTVYRSAAVQAFAAVLTMLVTVGLFLLNSNAERRAASAEERAVRADQRTERSELENDRLRQAAEKQAAAMQALAVATAEQAELLRSQKTDDSRIRLHLLDVGQQVTVGGNQESSRRPAFVLLNMSAYPVFVLGVTFQTVPGPLQEVMLRESDQLAPDRSVLLAPGESRKLGLPMVTGLQPYTGGSAARLMGFGVFVHCLYPGQAPTVRAFRVVWADWRDESEVTITSIDANGSPRLLDQANAVTA